MTHYRFKLISILILLTLLSHSSRAQEFSTAGFYALKDVPRKVYSMNPAWRFHKGDVHKGEQVDFDDNNWAVVGLPNGIELLPIEASGGINYRGVIWYRKHFSTSNLQLNKRTVLYFEAVMGKSQIYVNGQLVHESFSGFVPFSVDITAYLNPSGENLIAVCADNSDDADFPPGKPQAALDFCYFGGIYRDVWMYTTDSLYITDPILSNKPASGGYFHHFENVSDEAATAHFQLELHNGFSHIQKGSVNIVIIAPDGKPVKQLKQKYSIQSTQEQTLDFVTRLNKPMLWSPDAPHLYQVEIYVKDDRGRILDAYRQRMGIRSIRFSVAQGLILNGKPFPRKLIGANRHQDYAIIGNALSNSLHWRDAKKLKEAGMDIIRNAHYPQDPAFMDACAELGLFVIVNTPGWQFWNPKPIFKERVYQNIRDIVRTERNNPSVIMWEPILNETWYPEDFAKTVDAICKEEYPVKDCYTAGDLEARGNQYLDIQFMHPYLENSNDSFNRQKKDSTKVSFTREFGDNVDNWNSHNSPSRVARQWGEVPQLIQAIHYLNPPYPYTCIDALHRTDSSHIGGTLWHSFDHQRGYHPDPFYGGIMDAFRRPKFSYYMFRSQSHQVAPMVFIAHLMTPFSPSDVTVFSNCEEIRLHTRVGDTLRIVRQPQRNSMNQGAPSPAVVFKNAFDVMTDKAIARTGAETDSYLYAEGLIDGKVVATHRVTPSRRATGISLLIDTLSCSPEANGGDLVAITAQVVDSHGTVKRLNNTSLQFEVEGEGRLMANHSVQPVVWGEATVLIQTTTNSGKVRVRVSPANQGDHTLKPAELVFETLPSKQVLIYNAQDNEYARIPDSIENEPKDLNEQQQKNTKLLKEVEKQQSDFGENR